MQTHKSNDCSPSSFAEGYMKNIKHLCGLLDPDHFQQQSHESTRGSLRQIILLHPYFEYDCFQGGESLPETLSICKRDFSNCMLRVVHCALKKKYGHDRIWLSGFSKSVKNVVPSSRVEIGLSSALNFVVPLQGWDGGRSFNSLPTEVRRNFRKIKKKRPYSLSQAVCHLNMLPFPGVSIFVCSV